MALLCFYSFLWQTQTGGRSFGSLVYIAFASVRIVLSEAKKDPRSSCMYESCLLLFG